MSFEMIIEIHTCSECPNYRHSRDRIHLDRHCIETDISFEKDFKYGCMIHSSCPYNKK